MSHSNVRLADHTNTQTVIDCLINLNLSFFGLKLESKQLSVREKKTKKKQRINGAQQQQAAAAFEFCVELKFAGEVEVEFLIN